MTRHGWSDGGGKLLTVGKFHPGLKALLMSSIFLVTAAPSLLAQTGTVAGTVVAASTLDPLAGAQVSVVGTTVRAVSDERGQFRLAGLSGTTVALEVRRIGYSMARLNARVGDDEVRITLAPSATSLEAVVVTGTAGAAQKRELGNAIGTINAAEVVATAPIVSMQSLLNGRTPGVVIMPTSGQVGSGSQQPRS